MARALRRGAGAIAQELLHPAILERMKRHHGEPSARRQQLLRRGDFSSRIADLAVEPGIVANSVLQFFMVAAFDRAVAREGERGYRSTLLAAGGLARQIAAVAAALGLGRATCDFHDRELDALLSLDGLSRSAVHLLAIGAAAK